MGSLLCTNAIPLAQLTLGQASMLASYVKIGTFTAPVVFGYIISTLDQPVQVSFDGVNDHIAVPKGSTVTTVIPIGFKENLTVLPTCSVYVKNIGTPTAGSIYINGFSAQTP